MRNKTPPPPAFNYIVGFYDLLGQRAALRGQGMLKLPFASQADEDAFREADGLMNFICLGDTSVNCPTSAVFSLFGLAGSLCHLGLASSTPIRGAIDLAWGVELHKGELYGAAVARAYELESEIAQYPRIVVGEEVMKYIGYQRQNPGQDTISLVNRTFADLAFSLLAKDADGIWIVDYLGSPFCNAVSGHTQHDLYQPARDFVVAQLKIHSEANDQKLAPRYESLLKYFDSSPLARTASTAAS